MKKLLFALAVLALVIVLLPMQEAKAEWHNGDTCPGCGNNTVFITTTSVSISVYYHQISCSECWYFEWENNDDGVTLEGHYGGTATCTSGRTCEGCGQVYGSPDTNAHNWDMDNWTTEEGADTHWHACKNSGCTAKTGEEPHSGGTPTCTEKAVCDTCNQPYGNAMDHFWDRENWTTDGTDHWHKCIHAGCTERTDQAAHSGGTAYCNAKAKCAVCEQEYGEVDLNNHAPGKFHPATCIAAAYCEVEDRIFDNGNYDKNNHVGESVDVWGYPPTCMKKGLSNGKKCSACQAFTVEQTDIPIDETAHNWDMNNWSYNDGDHWRACLNGCNQTLYYAAHSGGTATCVSKPVCKDCNQEYGEKNPNNHDWLGNIVWRRTVLIPYTSAFVQYKCQRNCGEYYKQEMHFEKTTTATCEKDGEDIYTATLSAEESLSGVAYEEEKRVFVSALGHDWALDTTQGVNGWSWAEDGSSAMAYLKCTRDNCGKTATATDSSPVPGAKTYDANTGKVSCTYTAAATKDNKTFNATLTVESDPIKRQTDLWVAAGKTYTAEPQSVPESYDCHYQVDRWTGPVLTADSGVYEQNGEFYRNVTYTNTLNYVVTDAFIQKVDAIPATCTEKAVAGHYQCKQCLRLYTENTAENEVTLEALQTNALGHDLKKTDKVEPTCTDPGTEAYWTCQRKNCGKLFSDGKGEHVITEPVTINALGHDLKKTDKVEPTCTDPGTEAYWTCQRKNCGKLFSDGKGEHAITEPVTIPIDKDAHPADQIKNIAGQAATCTATGLTDGKQCQACKAFTVKQEEIPALGHDLIHHAAQAPTCTAIGWDAYDTCSRCDYTTYAEKAALGHDLVHHAAQAPTCTAIGWEAYDTCSRCDYTTYAEIPALGHDYRETDCTIIRVYSECRYCGGETWTDNVSSRDLIPGLVRDENGKNVRYAAGIGYQNGKRVLNVTPDGSMVGLALYLTPAQVKEWLAEGVYAVIFGKWETKLQIILADISDALFPLDEGETITAYVFTATPEAAMFAETKDGLIPAEAFDGVALVS